MIKRRFAISFHSVMTLITISVLLFPFYIYQFASSQSQVSPPGQQQSEQDSQAGNSNLQGAVSGIRPLEEEEDATIIANGQQHASNSSSPFIFSSQKQFFFPSVNATRQTDVAILNGTWTVDNSRAITQSLARLDPQAPKMAFMVDHYIPSNETDRKIHLRIYDPGVEGKPCPALVFVHGGGWTVGSVDEFDSSIRRLANSSGLLIAAMDYRLAPENPFPAALNDVIATVKWIKENGESIGIDPNRIALGGDSAGANLALASAIALRNEGQGDAVRALYLLYGLYTPDKNTESMQLFGNGEYGITKTQFQWVMNMTFQRRDDWSNPLAFPILDNLTGNLPPMYIAAMGLDPLRDDSILLSEKLKLAGQEYYLSIWPGVAHGALSLISVTPEIEKYVDALSTYLRGVLMSDQQAPAEDNAYMRARTEHIQVGDINIAYKRFGQGKPILFISGTSQTKDAWEPTLLSELAATNHTVIVFDNRGMGETTIGTRPFSIEQFANDTAGLLDALQVEKPDVFGASLGSFVAQELALHYPQRVDRLVLSAGYCGGNEAVYPSGQAAETLMTLASPEVLHNMTAEQQAMILAPIMFPPGWLEEHPEILNSVIQLAPVRSATPEIIQQQGLAVGTWKGSCDRLSSIMQPTLVIVGDQDLLAPPANSVMMAQRIPNSWLVLLEGTGHGAMWQVPNEFTAYIQNFLETTK
ncbi:MAG TPA: alpha/beta fold hydrolase [Nitrososphaeraceae archaeon]|nr:alpha/beta fold hydrolase [Nitrososphaeraceae archaeon]